MCQHGLELDSVQEQDEPTCDEHDAAVGRAAHRHRVRRRVVENPDLRVRQAEHGKQPLGDVDETGGLSSAENARSPLGGDHSPAEPLGQHTGRARPHQPRDERDRTGDRNPGDQEVHRDNSEDDKHDRDNERCHEGDRGPPPARTSRVTPDRVPAPSSCGEHCPRSFVGGLLCLDGSARPPVTIGATALPACSVPGRWSHLLEATRTGRRALTGRRHPGTSSATAPMSHSDGAARVPDR